MCHPLVQVLPRRLLLPVQDAILGGIDPVADRIGVQIRQTLPPVRFHRRDVTHLIEGGAGQRHEGHLGGLDDLIDVVPFHGNPVREPRTGHRQRLTHGRPERSSVQGHGIPRRQWYGVVTVVVLVVGQRRKVDSGRRRHEQTRCRCARHEEPTGRRIRSRIAVVMTRLAVHHTTGTVRPVDTGRDGRRHALGVHSCGPRSGTRCHTHQPVKPLPSRLPNGITPGGEAPATAATTTRRHGRWWW